MALTNRPQSRDARETHEGDPRNARERGKASSLNQSTHVRVVAKRNAREHEKMSADFSRVRENLFVTPTVQQSKRITHGAGGDHHRATTRCPPCSLRCSCAARRQFFLALQGNYSASIHFGERDSELRRPAYLRRSLASLRDASASVVSFLQKVKRSCCAPSAGL